MVVWVNRSLISWWVRSTQMPGASSSSLLSSKRWLFCGVATVMAQGHDAMTLMSSVTPFGKADFQAAILISHVYNKQSLDHIH